MISPIKALKSVHFLLTHADDETEGNWIVECPAEQFEITLLQAQDAGFKLFKVITDD